MKVAFIVNDLALSGGIGVVVQHARQLHDHHDCEVWLVLAREQDDPHWDHDPLAGLHVAQLAEARELEFDIAVSTWWETAFVLFDLKAARYVSFVQSLEDRFYSPGQVERLGASLVLNLPVSFITEATWIRETLADLRPDAPVHLVVNGVDKDVFAPVAAIEREDARPLRVLVEGYADSWFKGVNDAIMAVGLMQEPHALTVVAPSRHGLHAGDTARVIGPISQREMAEEYARTDVLVKLSRVEGMYGPPLEAFHKGATCVTTEVTGYDQYVRHGHNALVCDWDDPNGTARQLDLLARDRELLTRLRTNALATANAWPDWSQSGEQMAHALREIAAAPPPDPSAGAARMLADLRSGMEAVRIQYRRRDELQRSLDRYDRLRRLPGVRSFLRWHASERGQRLLKFLHPATRRVKRLLLGGGS